MVYDFLIKAYNHGLKYPKYYVHDVNGIADGIKGAVGVNFRKRGEIGEILKAYPY